MNTKLISLTIFLLLISSFSLSVMAQNSITISVKNIKEVKGALHIAIYTNDTNWLSEEHYFKKIIVDVLENNVSHSLHHLPPGNYAISLFHDENNDGKMNMNWIGIPAEKFGFSNNPRVIMSAPSFEDALVTLKEKALHVEITLQGF